MKVRSFQSVQAHRPFQNTRNFGFNGTTVSQHDTHIGKPVMKAHRFAASFLTDAELARLRSDSIRDTMGGAMRKGFDVLTPNLPEERILELLKAAKEGKVLNFGKITTAEDGTINLSEVLGQKIGDPERFKPAELISLANLVGTFGGIDPVLQAINEFFGPDYRYSFVPAALAPELSPGPEHYMDLIMKSLTEGRVASNLERQLLGSEYGSSDISTPIISQADRLAYYDLTGRAMMLFGLNTNAGKKMHSNLSQGLPFFYEVTGQQMAPLMQEMEETANEIHRSGPGAKRYADAMKYFEPVREFLFELEKREKKLQDGTDITHWFMNPYNKIEINGKTMVPITLRTQQQTELAQRLYQLGVLKTEEDSSGYFSIKYETQPGFLTALTALTKGQTSQHVKQLLDEQAQGNRGLAAHLVGQGISLPAPAEQKALSDGGNTITVPATTK